MSSKPKQKITKITNRHIHGEHRFNRAGSSFPKDDHSATQTELKTICTMSYIRWNVTETETAKIKQYRTTKKIKIGLLPFRLFQHQMKPGGRQFIPRNQTLQDYMIYFRETMLICLLMFGFYGQVENNVLFRSKAVLLLWSLLTLRKHVWQYTAIFHGYKNDYFQMKIVIFFFYFCSKHIWWILVRTASLRRF